MNSLNIQGFLTYLIVIFKIFFLCTVLETPAHAHLMVNQHGTLQFGKGGYYFVLSLPITALSGIDDNSDGLLSHKEFNYHYEKIKSTVGEGLCLESKEKGLMMIEGLLINMSHNHNENHKTMTHVIALGRFNVETSIQDLELKINLFGEHSSEKEFYITITNGTKKEKTVISVPKPTHVLFE